MVKTKQPIRQLPKTPPTNGAPTKAPKKLPAPKAADVAPEAPADENTINIVQHEDVVVVMIPLEQITMVPDEFRKDMSEKEELQAISDTAHNMNELGLLQPIVVKALPAEGRYEVIAGRIRIKAATLLGWETIPATIRDYNEHQQEMAVLAENLTRKDYSKASKDRAIARSKALYEILHPETKRGVAGGKSSQDKIKAGKAGNKVASAKKAPSFTKTMATTTGLKPRAIEKAAKRGNTFTDDDYTVFKTKNITRHQQDQIAATTDPRKRAAIIGAINGGAKFQAAYDSVMLPAGAKSASVEINDGVNRVKPVTDEEWLAACPIRGKVVTKMFDAQALLYRMLIDNKTITAKILKKAHDEYKGLLGKQHGFGNVVNTYVKSLHPNAWKICGTCDGKGSVDSKQCSDCDGGGFKVN